MKFCWKLLCRVLVDIHCDTLQMKLWIYEIHIFELRKEEINAKKILAVINATYAVAKTEKAWKNQACPDSNPDLCDTGAAL